MQMYDGGFILLYRSILNWEWYGDKNTTLLFFHLLLTVNYMPGEWQGRQVEVGQRITSLSKLSQEIHMTIKEIRTGLKHLQQTGEVTCEATRQYTVITIKNYEKYQSRAHVAANNGHKIGHAAGKRGANKGQQYNKGIKKQRKEYISGVAAPSEDGGLPAEGKGDDSIVIDGRLYRFPSRWRRDAEAMGKDLALFVKGMYQ